MSHTVTVEWTSILDTENTLIPTVFTMKVSFDGSEDGVNNVVAIDRIKILEQELQDSILIHQDAESIDFYINKNVRVINLPDEPHTMLVGLAIVRKIMAVTEGYLTIKGATIMSSQEPEMFTELDLQNTKFLDAYCADTGFDSWFMSAGPDLSDVDTANDMPSWSNYALDWYRQEQNARPVATFGASWTPVVILGGKQHESNTNGHSG